MIDLWGYDISWFVWFCAAGKSFFPGIGLLILAAAMPLSKKVIWVIITRYIFVLLGIALVILSATPLNGWIYVIWAASFLAFLFVIILRPHSVFLSKLCKTAFLCICVIALLAEWPFHLNQKIPQNSFEKLYVIGDSVSAGIGGKNEHSWPKIFGEQHGVEVINLAMSGATAGSALTQTGKVTDEHSIVFIEIGGNDLFAPTPIPVFEQNLRSLLQKVTNSNRVILMLELPLAPLHIRYGHIQRKLADEYGVILIPKSFLADVLSTKGATVDLAHLSSEGHKIMADKVWSLLGKSLQVQSGNK